MTGAVSLIVVSRHRPRALLRALAGIAQMDHPGFEVILVADPEAAAAVRAAGWTVKLAVFDEANISAARNLGLSLAAAPVVAFLDDDAVPEPSWLSRLAAPLADPAVVAAGGFVRGRSGMAWQWTALAVDRGGFDHTLAAPADRTSLHRSAGGRAVKTQGTNCAFRTEALRAAGGFDPALRFFLDEADVNLRLAAAGPTAVVPDAVVHHGFAESARRRADRVPRDLHEIGASRAVFLRRHAVPDAEAVLARHRAMERRRLVAHMVAGLLEPRDVGRLLATFDAGLAEGAARPLPALAPLAADPPAFLPLPGTGPRSGLVTTDAAGAARGRAEGRVVTLVSLSRGLRRHRLEFGDDGLWRQDGGLSGLSDRDLPRPRCRTAENRLQVERARLSRWRPV